MPRIVGVDPSLSRTGVCIMNGEEARTDSIKTSKKDGCDYERQKKIVRELIGMLEAGDVVVFEDFGQGGRWQPSGKFVERIELAGMMKMFAQFKTKREFLEVRPSHLKSFVAGKATASKETVFTAVSRRWGIEVANQDEADAAALALIGRAVVSGCEQDLYGKRNTLGKVECWKANKKALMNFKAHQQLDSECN